MKLLSYFKKRDEPLVPFNFSMLGTDVHSHLIPGIDDGSPSISDSINLINGMVQLGYSKLITTPHVMSDFYRNTSSDILNGLDNLNQNVLQQKIPIKIEAAAEYYMDYEFMSKLANHEVLTFGQKYLLVECSFVDPPRNLDQILFEIQVNGYKPVLAHPERYLYWNNNLKFFHQLYERDVLFQLNLLSLAGIYSPGVEKTANYLIANKLYNFIGSDLHHEKHMGIMSELKIHPNLYQQIQELDLYNNRL